MIRVVLCMAVIGVIGALTGVGAPGAVRAEPAPAADKRQLARQYVDAGLAAQQAGDYDTAITMYEKAYKLVPHPVLIFNMAQAQRLAGKRDEALRAYRRYLAEAPDGDQAQTAREFVAELEAALASEPAVTAPGATEPITSGGAREAGGARVSQAPGDALRDSAAAPEREAAPGRALRIAGLVAGGAGVAALGVGIGFGLHARSLSNELSKPGAVYDPDKVHAGDRADKLAIAGYVSGGALVVAGAVLYWQGYAAGRAAEKPVVAPVISDRGVGLALVGRWP